MSARLDLLGRTGDARLEGVLAALLCGRRRAWLAPVLAKPLGMRLARRVADLVGLHTAPHRPFPDERRRAGLVRLATAADLGVLHAVAAAVLAGRRDPEATQAREQVDWSTLHAEDAGLLGEAPLEPLRAHIRQALPDTDVADRCWAETRAAYADGRIATAAEGEALTWRWRAGTFPRLVVTVGPSGSGKSRFVERLSAVDEIVSLDGLRAARGDRADQRANAEILHSGLDRLDKALGNGGTVVWDATCINPQQRATVHAVADRRDALVTHAVLLVPEGRPGAPQRRAGAPGPAPGAHRATATVLPPYPGDAHRTWYVGR